MISAPPNILLVLTDQQRWDSLGCYGAPGVHTPNLDRLATESVRYDRCYTNTPICTPARACLWTGKHILGHGVHAIHDCLPDDEVLFSHRLREIGYDTALFGKLHVSGIYRERDGRHPNNGFDVYELANDPYGPWGLDNAYLRWLQAHDPALRDRVRHGKTGNIPVGSHMTTWAAERTIDFLRGRKTSGRPFFCCMSLFDPHSPYVNYPKEMEDVLDVANLPAVIARDQNTVGRPIAHEWEPRWNVKVPGPVTLAAWRIGYHAAVAHIDSQLGRVLAVLSHEGLDERTTVLFTSDHGDMLGDHGLMTKGAYFYDACTRVPMILRSPDTTPRVETAPVQLHDVAATCLQLAGVEPQTTLRWSPDGISLLDSEALRERNRAVCLYRSSGNIVKEETGYRGPWDPPVHATMWFQDGHKLNVYHAPEADARHPGGELYDLRGDPNEMRNLWDAPQRRQLKAATVLRMLDWLALEEVRGRARGADASGDRYSPGRPRPTVRSGDND